MEKISEKSGAVGLPDVSEKNDCRENIASAFANNQFGQKQMMGAKRLQAGKNGGFKSSGARGDAPSKTVRLHTKRLVR
jgi:hypothetical protein